MKVYKLKLDADLASDISVFISKEELDTYLDKLNSATQDRKIFILPDDNNVYAITYGGKKNKIKEAKICGSIVSFDLMIISKYITIIDVYRSINHINSYLECEPESQVVNPSQRQYWLELNNFKLYDYDDGGAFYANITLMVTSNNLELDNILINSTLPDYIIKSFESRGLAKQINRFYIQKDEEYEYICRREYIVPVVV